MIQLLEQPYFCNNCYNRNVGGGAAPYAPFTGYATVYRDSLQEEVEAMHVYLGWVLVVQQQCPEVIVLWVKWRESHDGGQTCANHAVANNSSQTLSHRLRASGQY